MRFRLSLTAMLLASALGVSATRAQEPSSFRLPVFSPRGSAVVGLWQVYVSVRPCAAPTAPPTQFFAINAFQLGGTLSDANSFPPASRGPGMGVWSYDPVYDKYHTRMQFARFVDGVFDGVQDVRTDLTVSPDRQHTVARVHALVLNVDGSTRVELCGSAVGDRQNL